MLVPKCTFRFSVRASRNKLNFPRKSRERRRGGARNAQRCSGAARRRRSSSGFSTARCVRETEILVEQQPPQGFLVCDHAGLVINKFSLRRRRRRRSRGFRTAMERRCVERARRWRRRCFGGAARAAQWLQRHPRQWRQRHPEAGSREGALGPF
jgi:hypothetical protein